MYNIQYMRHFGPNSFPTVKLLNNLPLFKFELRLPAIWQKLENSCKIWQLIIITHFVRIFIMNITCNTLGSPIFVSYFFRFKAKRSETEGFSIPFRFVSFLPTPELST